MEPPKPPEPGHESGFPGNVPAPESSPSPADVERLKYEYALRQAVHNAYLDVGKATVTLAISRAEFIEKAAAAVAALYTAMLAYSFKVDNNRAIPLRGLAPAVFLGLSIMFSATFVAYIRRQRLRNIPTLDLAGFLTWTLGAIEHRTYLLRMAAVSLSFGILFLPSPYLHIRGVKATISFWSFFVCCMFSLLVLPAIVHGIIELMYRVTRGVREQEGVKREGILNETARRLLDFSYPKRHSSVPGAEGASGECSQGIVSQAESPDDH